MVGQRIVVRRILPGETGPSGGPALTDVLGVCLSWADGTCVVQREDELTVVAEPQVTDLDASRRHQPKISCQRACRSASCGVIAS